MLDGSGRWVFKVEVRRRTEATWTDVTNVAGGDWVLAVSVDGDSPDKPVGSFTVRLLRAADGYSMAPGVSGSALNNALGLFSPLIYAGRLIRIYAANLSAGQTRSDAVWRPWMEGEIDRADWPDDVLAQCSTLDGVVQRRQIEAEEVRGTPDPGVPLETEIQGLLTRWPGASSPISLLTVGSPDHGVGEYKTPVGSLGDFLLTQAQRIAWDLRYRWDEASGAFRYTLYLPPRGKATPDLTLPAYQVFDVPELSLDRTNVRNAFTVTYPDSATGNAESRYGIQQESIDEFDRQWMGITEPADSSIDTAAKADALLSFARSDLAKPPTEKRARIPFMPFLTLHHMVRILADGKRFDFDQSYSVVGVSHEVTADGAHTLVNLRGGSPVGMYYAWQRRNAGSTGVGSTFSPSGEDGLINFREYTDADGITTLAWDRVGTLVQEVWVASVVFGEPLPTDPWALVAGAALPLAPGTLSVSYPQPGEGQRRLVQVETRLAFMEQGPTYRVNQFGTPAPIDWSAIPTETTTDVKLGVRVTDPRRVISAVRFYTLILGTRSGPFAATVTDGNYYAYTLALDPKHPVGIQPELVRNDGFPPILGETYTADIDKAADIKDVRRQRTGDSEVILVDADTDTVSLWYKEDVAGVLGAETVIPPRGGDPRFGSFTVVAGATVRTFRIYGKNLAGEVGEYADWRVEPFAAAPALNVVATPGTTNYSILWSGDSVTLSINGAAFAAPPASPITVARGAAGTAPLDYTFKAIRDGVPVTNSVTVPPLGADSVVPDLTVTPGTADNATASFTAAATNPRTGGAVSVIVTLVGCTATVSGSAFTSGSTLAGGAVLVVTRPAFGAAAGTVTFTATIASAGEIYGGSERIQRTVPSVQRDTVALTARAIVSPAANATPDTQVILRVAVSDPYPGATVSVAYSASGVGSITPVSPQTVGSITNDITTTGTVDFTVPRPASGSAVGRVVFTASATGRSQGVDSADIAPQAPTTPAVAPALDALWLSVVNHPANPGPGYVDVFDVSWDLSSTVTDASHRLDVTFTTSGTAVNTQTGLLPSAGGASYVKTGVGSTVRQHAAKVTLRTVSGNGTLANLESTSVSTTIDATPYP